MAQLLAIVMIIGVLTVFFVVSVLGYMLWFIVGLLLAIFTAGDRGFRILRGLGWK